MHNISDISQCRRFAVVPLEHLRAEYDDVVDAGYFGHPVTFGSAREETELIGENVAKGVVALESALERGQR